jgi:hypothetical protein
MFSSGGPLSRLFLFTGGLLIFCSGLEAGFDRASSYSSSGGAGERWVSGGHKGDIEFAPWVLEAVPNGGTAGWTIADSLLGGGDINTQGKSFALFASPNISPVPYAAATKKFAKSALSTGDRLSFRMAINYRSPGDRGFDLRSGGVGVWNFNVRSGGYYVNGDSGTSLGAHNSNTIFDFTFLQKERMIEYHIKRSGGISAEVTGTIPAASGTWQDLRFYISGAGDIDGARNYLYFNSFELDYADRRNDPLTLGERRILGNTPTYFIRFTDPLAQSVTLRHGGDWNVSHTLTKDNDGVWAIDVRTLNLAQGWHDFKFRLDGAYESGDNRKLYIDEQGRVAQPPAVYLTWQADPSSTMTVCWINDDEENGDMKYRKVGQSEWTTLRASPSDAPYARRFLRTIILEQLDPDTEYEFMVSGYVTVYRFRTAPARISSPIKFVVTGDVDVNDTADAMARATAAQEPLFIAVIGDHAYEDSKADLHWKWARYFESWHRWFRGTNNRLIPIVPGVGNHEMFYGMAGSHADFDNSAEWRKRYGIYYYHYFPFPGAGQPYGALDFGNYLSLIVLDTEHSSPTITGSDQQSLWFGSQLEARDKTKHLLPLYHVPAYPSNRAFTDPLNTRVRSAWTPLMENAGVQLAFEHHDHTYKRTKPLRGGVESPGGTVFMGDGAWGVSTRGVDLSRPYLAQAASVNHSIIVTLTPTSRQINVIDTSGQVIDSLTQTADYIPPAPLPPQPIFTQLSNLGIQISWDGVEEGNGYRVFRNGALIGETSSTSFLDAGWNTGEQPVYSVRAYNDGGEGVDSPLISLSPKQIWALSNGVSGSPDELDGFLNSDPDGDGILSIAEYFHGTSPHFPESEVPLVVEGVANGYYSFLYKRSPVAQGVAGQIWKTGNLETEAWSTVADGISEELTGSRSGWIRFRIPLSGAEEQGFYRLKVE